MLQKLASTKATKRPMFIQIELFYIPYESMEPHLLELDAFSPIVKSVCVVKIEALWKRRTFV